MENEDWLCYNGILKYLLQFHEKGLNRDRAKLELCREKEGEFGRADAIFLISWQCSFAVKVVLFSR